MRTQENNRQACNNTSNVWRLNTLAAAMAVAMGGFSAGAFAAAPAANSTIGNTATATYTDASAVPRSATSNTVQTTVQQVSGFTLVSDNTRLVAPGGQVVYPHTLTNTGNGSESFTLSKAQSGADNIDLNSFFIYADLDGNGVPDNAVDLTGTNVTVASGGVFKFVVVGSAPGTAIAGNTAITTVTATTVVSAFNPVADALTNTDTATVTADAVINIVKSANVVTGPTGTVVEYTLTYTNTGNNTATNVTITDAIPQGVSPFGGMIYQANSGVWSAGGALNDLTGSNDPAGITYEITGTAPTQTVNAVIASVGANVSGTIKFSVMVDNSTTDGNKKAAPGILTNTANFTYDPDGAGAGAVTTSQPTNSVNFTVTQTSDVSANDNPANSSLDGSPIVGTILDTVEVATAGQGTTVLFSNIIHNTGNGSDSFNVTYANAGGGAGFPSGTSFQLFQADGNNVLQDSNSDGVPNTPVIQPGESYTVILKATLPANITGNNGGLGFSVVKTATSIANPLENDTVTDKLDAIVSNVVDLSNNTVSTPSTLGQGGATDKGAVDDGGAAWSTLSVNPGASAIFPLLVQNKVGVADNYDLTASATTPGMTALPAGWTVVFRSTSAANCLPANLGATLTNTGTINAAASRLVCAVVTTPSTQAPTTQDVFFKVASPVSLANDIKKDAVTVNTFRNLSMSLDRTGQVFPNGSVVYEHTLTNNGNVTEGDAASEIQMGATNSLGGFTTVLYIDSNSNGVLDSTDRAFTSANFDVVTTDSDGAGAIDVPGTGLGNGLAGLTPGESIRIFAKVQASSNATPGTTDTATITANVVGTVGATLPSSTVGEPTDPVNTDTTNVVGGQIRLDKEQALDAACDGNADGAGFSNANISALPGACIMYRIVATNEGVSQVEDVLINDTTPTFTTLFSKVPGTYGSIVVTTATTPAVTGSGTNNTFNSQPADGATGAFIVNVGDLNGGQTGTFTFSVKIDQ